MKKIILKIGGMTCSACSSGLEKHLNKQKGIISASVNLVLAQAQIEYDEKIIDYSYFDKYISDAGFKNLGEYTFDEDKSNNKRYYLLIFFVLLVLIMYISMSNMVNLPSIPFLYINKHPIRYIFSLLLLTICFLIYGFDIIKNGFKNIIYKHPNMDSLVSVGVLSSFIYSVVNMILFMNGNKDLVHHLYFESCAMIIYFVKVGRFIDRESKEKTKIAIKELVQITPDKAFIKRDGEVIETTIDEVKKDDILVCKPGQKIAVDGEIVKGSSHIDESFITGESVSPKKGVNSKVVAGSICIDGYIEYKALKIGKDSTISEIVRLVLDASGTKAPIARLADVASSYFVPLIFIIAFITFISYLFFGDFNSAINHFVTVLVVACPCALGLATPLAIVVSMGKCAKEGILVKSSEILENVSKANTVIFDKTGTLTYGKLKISKMINYSKMKDQEILEYVKTLEKQSSHPIALAFKDIKTDYLVDEFEILPGIGLFGIVNDKEVYVGNNKLFELLNIKNKYLKDEENLSKDLNSIIYVFIDKKMVSLIGVKDIIRKDVKNVINYLKNCNKNVIMLSGDNKNTAKLVGDNLGINQIISDVVPKEKEEIVKKEKKNGYVVMVGDGINDALALSVSDIGISINSGTDIAIDTSSVILMNDNLNKIISLNEISKKTIKIIKQNLFWAFFYNLCMIPIAVGLFGFNMSPMYGSIFMTFSSLFVVLNSLRLRK